MKPFAILADALTSAGVGVLRYDDRGVGGSTGDYESATIAELAEDARAAIDYLETRDDIDPARIGLFGHSEGGLYSAILGASDPRVAWIGMMAPAVIDGVTLIVEQNQALLRSSGADDATVEKYAAYTAEAAPLARDGEFEALEAVIRDFHGRAWDELAPEDQVIAGDREAFIQRQVDAELLVYTSDWFRSLLAYDPASDWQQVSVPVLAIFGGKDAQVLADSNAAALRTALEAGGNEDVEIITIPDANHLFQKADTGSVGEYGKLEPVFVDGFIDAVVDWTTAGRRGRLGMESSETDRANSSGEGWHPEPELLDIRDEATSRPALERLGEGIWSAALDYVYDHGMERAIGEPADYAQLRRVFFGPSGEPAPAPELPTTSEALLEEFRTRLAPHQANAWHPLAFAYFTPIPPGRRSWARSWARSCTRVSTSGTAAPRPRWWRRRSCAGYVTSSATTSAALACSHPAASWPTSWRSTWCVTSPCAAFVRLTTRRAGQTSRVSACMRRTRPTSPSSAAWPRWAFPMRRWWCSPATLAFD